MYPTITYLNDFLDEIINGLDEINSPKIYNFSKEEQDCIESLIETNLSYNMVALENELEISFAMAGVSKDMIEIEKSGRIIQFVVKGIEDKDKKLYLHKGIKLPSNKDNITSVGIPEKYDVDKTIVKFDNGLLVFTIPLKEEIKPTKLEIN